MKKKGGSNPNNPGVSNILKNWDPKTLQCKTPLCTVVFEQAWPTQKHCDAHRKSAKTRAEDSKRTKYPSTFGFNEYPNGRTQRRLEFDSGTLEILYQHAERRKVSTAALIRDLLNGWVFLCTDYGADYWRAVLPKGLKAPDVPERWLGYNESLGFSPAVALQDAAAPNAGYERVEVKEPRHNVPPPPETAPSETRAWKQGDPIIAEVMPPEIALNVQAGPLGARVFNPEEHARNAAMPGHGNAAQQASEGRLPHQRHPEDFR